MKKHLMLSILVAALLLFSSVASAHEIEQRGRFGLGGALGWPGIGLSTNTFVADWMSVQAGAFAFWSFNGFAIDVDYLFWLHDIVQHKALDFTWYAGPGAAFAYWGGAGLGRFGTGGGGVVGGAIKGSVGLALQFKDAPVDLTWQLSPGVFVGEFGAGFWITSMLASRYYF